MLLRNAEVVFIDIAAASLKPLNLGASPFFIPAPFEHAFALDRGAIVT